MDFFGNINRGKRFSLCAFDLPSLIKSMMLPRTKREMLIDDFDFFYKETNNCCQIFQLIFCNNGSVL